MRYASNLPMTPSTLWPELKGWTKVLEKNRKRLEGWCTSAVGNVALELDGAAPSATASSSAASGAALGAELLAAVIAEPGDVARRLVYADWLVEQHNAQGELIQLSERRRELGEPDAELDARIKQLTAQYREPIAGEIAQLAGDYTLDGGFVTKIEMAAPTFAKHGERLLAQHPIVELELKPVNAKALARLATAPALRRLRRLRIGQIIGRQRPMPLDEICRSSLFDALVELQIWSWESEGDAAAAFASLRAPRLERLFLYEVDSAPRVVAGLAQNPSLRLRSLDINNRSRSEWPKGALASPALAELRALDLSVRGPEIAAIFDGAHLPELRILEISDGVSPERIDFPSLRMVRLHRKLDAREVLALVERHPRLAALGVWEMEPAEANRALEALVALPAGHPLRALSLRAQGADAGLVARAAQRFTESEYDRDLASD